MPFLVCRSDQIVRPQPVKEKIRRGAARAVARHAGFAAVGIEDAHLKISGFRCQSFDDGNAVAAGAVMTITNAPGKVSEITDRA